MTADPTPSPEAIRLAEKLFGRNHGCSLISAANLIDAEFADLRDMLEALILGRWEVYLTKYGSGAIGWTWRDEIGNEHFTEGPHDQLPPWPDSARKALAEQRSKR